MHLYLPKTRGCSKRPVHLGGEKPSCFRNAVTMPVYLCKSLQCTHVNTFVKKKYEKKKKTKQKKKTLRNYTNLFMSSFFYVEKNWFLITVIQSGIYYKSFFIFFFFFGHYFDRFFFFSYQKGCKLSLIKYLLCIL